MGVALLGALAFASCKSSKESRYRRAFEKADPQVTTTTVVTPVNPQDSTAAPVAVTPVTPVTPVAVATPAGNTRVVAEDVTLVSGSGLKAYSVVVGSFAVEANAVVLQNKLIGEGYQAQVAKSPSNMFRVIISTHDDKTSAAQSRDAVVATYEGAWLLYKK